MQIQCYDIFHEMLGLTNPGIFMFTFSLSSGKGSQLLSFNYSCLWHPGTMPMQK